jgi:hypothetical protein
VPTCSARVIALWERLGCLLPEFQVTHRAQLEGRQDDVPRYGDFPHLFADLVPDAPVDIGNDVILARLLIDGRVEDLRRTHALNGALPRLNTLEMPQYLHRVWRRFLEEYPGTELNEAANDRANTDSCV